MNINRLLDRYSDLNPTYGNGLTNHLSMSMYAQKYLGKKEEDIVKFAEKYIQDRDLDKIEPTNLQVNNLYDHLGNKSSYEALSRFFYDQILKSDYEIVIGRYVDDLLVGSGGDAFHGMIRLAYALESKNDKEISFALAYLASSYVNFNLVLDNLQENRPMDSFIRLSKNQHFLDKSFKGSLIIERMIEVAKDTKLDEVINLLPEDSLNIKSMSQLAITLYSKTCNFTMLHGFTSTHALSLLLPYVKDKKRIMQLHWLHIQIAYLSTNCVPISYVVNKKIDINWQHIFDQAIRSTDDHTHKLIHSLHKSFKAYLNEEWSDLYAIMAYDRIKNDSSVSEG